MNNIKRSIFSLLFVSVCVGLNNGLAKTPQMGWNSWNKFNCGVNEKVIKDTIDKIVELGLDKVGYKYVNVDDCWAGSRDDKGNILADPKTFPSGMKALADYAHSKGLLFGLYSDTGTKTCAGRPGSYGYEEKDAASYASWGVDYLKYDNCYAELNSSVVKKNYKTMSKALLKQNRPIFFSMCDWGVADPASWAKDVGNSWRSTDDIQDTYHSMMYNALLTNQDWKASGPGGWNDPDMLEVGNGGMSTDEYKIHMSIWCIMKAPLLIGCDLNKVKTEHLLLLNNTEAVAVNQDALGIAGKIVRQTSQYHVWAGPLYGDSHAVVVYSLVNGYTDVKLDFLELFSQDQMSVRDIWEHKDLGTFDRSFTVRDLGYRKSVFLRLKSI